MVQFSTHSTTTQVNRHRHRPLGLDGILLGAGRMASAILTGRPGEACTTTRKPDGHRAAFQVLARL